MHKNPNLKKAPHPRSFSRSSNQQQPAATTMAKRVSKATASKAVNGGVKYAKFAKVGDIVHAKATDVHCDAELKDDDDLDEAPDMSSPPLPVVVSNNLSWFSEFDPEADVNGEVDPIEWSFRGHDGGKWVQGDDEDSKRPLLDYFMTTFPPAAMRHIIKETNEKLKELNQDQLDVGEFLKFIGVMILTTRFDFGDRRELFRVKAMSPYIPPPMINNTSGMSRKRFEEIWASLTFSTVPKVRSSTMSSAEYRWKHVDDFVDLFNKHRRANFVPSELICIDESMSRWYGNGGDWINEGLPHYIAIDRKVCHCLHCLFVSRCLTHCFTLQA